MKSIVRIHLSKMRMKYCLQSKYESCPNSPSGISYTRQHDCVIGHRVKKTCCMTESDEKITINKLV